MIYITWDRGDEEHVFEWFTVWPTRKQAMNHAREIADGRKVIYRNIKSNWSQFGDEKNCDAALCVVVEQRTSYYHGA